MAEKHHSDGTTQVAIAVSVIAILLSVGCRTTGTLAPNAIAGEPPTPREFRAAWVATVANIDWPSQPGLPSDQQKSELRAILDRAVALNLNAVVLQVRPAADALYASRLEPWSEYLTGAMGKAPEPYYDPLHFAVDEAHRRGLELHAWFNPFRALHPTASSPVDSLHISVVEPELVVSYGNQRWLDPGEPRARSHSLNVMLDVVERYDVDGIHMDDYFYPYHIEDSLGQTIPFPDSSSFATADSLTPGLSVNDWRRSNVDWFVEHLYTRVKEIKPHVKVGISPFGIWRPGYPEQIKGYDAYDRLYANSRKWLRQGWIDYFSPQLYWEIDKPEQSYTALLDWWDEQNSMNRHLWPGNFTSRVVVDTGREWTSEEIVDQIIATRERERASGNIHFSMRALMKHPSGMGRDLAEAAYQEPAVIPASPWLAPSLLTSPRLTWDDLRGRPILSLQPSAGGVVWLWVVKAKYRRKWVTQIVPGWRQTFEFDDRPRTVVVTAIDRFGQESAPVAIGAPPKR